jgi:assimilatory nitrate reductase catalytic subunit
MLPAPRINDVLHRVTFAAVWESPQESGSRAVGITWPTAGLSTTPLPEPTPRASKLAAARRIAPDLATVARKCGTANVDIATLFALWAATNRVASLYSQGVNQSWQGTDKVNTIINCHLATGRIGIPGAGPFSLIGQPNAMGGREVGGLANQLAAHMGFSAADIDRVGRFWGAPHLAQHEGLMAVAMFEAMARGGIKALWIMATNPAVSLPRADEMRPALTSLDLLVISDNVRSTDTIDAGPHVLLPAAAWGEKDGTVTNSERRISRQRAFARGGGEARLVGQRQSARASMPAQIADLACPSWGE